jgi:hypothetical protein
MTWSIQVATWTSNNRYPGVFRAVQSRVRHKLGPDLGAGHLRILSFGCSTGNEVAALRGYFPEALIFGCDVNQQALGEARRALQFDEAKIFESSPENIAKYGPYDVVFAMSVLCRFPESQNPELDSLRSLYSFESFENGVKLLAGCLADTGILCLFNTNYEVSQLAEAGSFRRIASPLVGNNGFVDRFRRDGQRLTHCERLGPHYVHRLRDGAEDASSYDFLNCIYEKVDTDAGPHWAKESKDEVRVDPALPTDPPDFFQFGPNLQYCAERRLRASALGYWFREGGEKLKLRRAWFRSTFDGRVEQGQCWTVDADPEIEGILRSNAHAGDEPAVDGPPPSRRLLDKLRSMAARVRSDNRYAVWRGR